MSDILSIELFNKIINKFNSGKDLKKELEVYVTPNDTYNKTSEIKKILTLEKYFPSYADTLDNITNIRILKDTKKGLDIEYNIIYIVIPPAKRFDCYKNDNIEVDDHNINFNSFTTKIYRDIIKHVLDNKDFKEKLIKNTDLKDVTNLLEKELLNKYKLKVPNEYVFKVVEDKEDSYSIVIRYHHGIKIDPGMSY